MNQGLAFQTIEIVDDGTDDSAPLNARTPPGLKVRLSDRSSVALPKHPLTLRVNQELEVLATRIRQMMQLRGGVLLTISIQQRVGGGDNGASDYKLNWVTVDRPGPVPSLVLRTQLASRPRRGRAGKGFVHRRIYLWATTA
jgi:hypothetical protein